MSIWIIHILNGISFGMLLFLLAAGLSLIFGMMGVLNLAHGSFYLLGAYIALTAIRQTNNFLLAAVVAPLFIGGVSIALHRFLFQRFYKEVLSQVLLTFGLIFVFADIALWIWGGNHECFPTHFFGKVIELWRRYCISCLSALCNSRRGHSGGTDVAFHRTDSDWGNCSGGCG